MAEWLFVLLICIFPSTFCLQEDNFPAFSDPDWYHFSSNDSFYFPRNECREISKKYKNGYCLRKPTVLRQQGIRANTFLQGLSCFSHRRRGTSAPLFPPRSAPGPLQATLLPYSAAIDPFICLQTASQATCRLRSASHFPCPAAWAPLPAHP